ncbi:peptidoglycan-recognition protein LC isoform X5 [Topomyia yanbarensis]|uniref:peptidoglycan-recognition protein LC isoform X5 n=1 Tax=Topomyia yanbarensis TaxID=2498891 RepID=UPI00273B40AA|nr:peptidoglycan-recognition protein LC isoform X5 [Topomyia yanbarensis]
MAKAKTQLNNASPAPDSATQSSSVPVNYPSNISDSVNQVVDKSDSGSSQNISISSINENDNNDSSTFESSDSECDDEQIKKAIERIPNALQPGGQLVQNGMLSINNENGSPTSNRGPNIGSIAVQNSSDITFGNKTYIKGQVVIKNIYHDRQNGIVNEGYQGGNETDGALGITKQKTDLNEPPSWRTSLKTIIRDKPLLSVTILVTLMLVITTIVIVTYLATSTDQDFLPDAKPLRIVTRNEWLAQPPKETLALLKLPVHKVIIAHTASEGCTTQTACAYRVRFIQETHMASEDIGDDIGYNFLIGGDGNVYEGRGWLTIGAYLRGQNSKSEGIAFIGDYQHLQPTRTQFDALDSLLMNGTKSGYLVDNFKLYGARQWQPTYSPGNILYERLQKHPHWSDELVD